MVTYRQVGRGMVRTLRAIDREAKRAERSRIAYERAAQKQAMLEAAAAAAAEYDDLITELTGAHRVSFSRRDWRTLATEPLPPAVERTSIQEVAAKAVEAKYRAGWLAKTFGLEKGQRAKLATAVVAARHCDEADYQERQEAAAARAGEIEFAQRLVAGDHAAVAEALERHSDVGGLAFCVEGLDVLFTDDGRVIAMVDGLDLEDMPDTSVSLLQSGRASVKPLTSLRILELHRDNICASAVRVALEFLHVLPVDAVEVVMHTDLLDQGSGHIGSEPVLYLRVKTAIGNRLDRFRNVCFSAGSQRPAMAHLGPSQGRRPGLPSIGRGACGHVQELRL